MSLIDDLSENTPMVFRAMLRFHVLNYAIRLKLAPTRGGNA